jgi:ribonuclease D
MRGVSDLQRLPPDTERIIAAMSEFPPPVFVDNPEALHSLAETLRGAARAAVDTESNSMHAYRERVCLVQISIPGTDYLVDPFALTDLSILSAFLEDPTREKVFHAAEYDLLCLRRDFGFHIRGLFDTHAAIRALGVKECGLDSLLSTEFGVRLDKRMQRADWGKRPLPDRQLEYARFDTHYLLPLRDRLAARIDAAGWSEELRDEFLRLEGIPDLAPEGEEGDPFWRIRGAQDLSPAQRAILRSVFDWREQQAERVDRPPFHILGEMEMTRIAAANPLSLDELKEQAGLGSRAIQRWGREILLAVEEGRKQKPPVWIRKRGMDEQAQARLENLRKWRKNRAAARGVESDVIISRDTMFRIARTAPDSLSALSGIPGLGPWRLSTYGKEILDVIHPGTS